MVIYKTHTGIIAGGVDDGKNCDRIVLTLFLSVCDIDNWDLGSFGTLLSTEKIIKKEISINNYTVNACCNNIYGQSSTASLSLSVVISLCACGTDK